MESLFDLVAWFNLCGWSAIFLMGMLGLGCCKSKSMQQHPTQGLAEGITSANLALKPKSKRSELTPKPSQPVISPIKNEKKEEVSIILFHFQ